MKATLSFYEQFEATEVRNLSSGKNNVLGEQINVIFAQNSPQITQNTPHKYIWPYKNHNFRINKNSSPQSLETVIINKICEYEQENIKTKGTNPRTKLQENILFPPPPHLAPNLGRGAKFGLRGFLG